jgi:CRP/FNR family transcriptional regulator, cyclic AMP receptor protein
MFGDPLSLLTESAWVQGLSASLREALFAAGKVVRIGDGRAVYRQGDAPDGLYAVLKGQVRLNSYSESGASQLMLVARPVDWFGEVSTLDGGPRPQDAIGEGECAVFHVSHAQVEQLGAREPNLWRAVGRLACGHQRKALGYIQMLVSVPPAGRVAAFLVSMSDRAGGTLSVTQEEIAAGVGLSRQTVSGVLARMERGGLVRLGYRRIDIADRRRLRSLMSG